MLSILLDTNTITYFVGKHRLRIRDLDMRLITGIMKRPKGQEEVNDNFIFYCCITLIIFYNTIYFFLGKDLQLPTEMWRIERRNKKKRSMNFTN